MEKKSNVYITCTRHKIYIKIFVIDIKLQSFNWIYIYQHKQYITTYVYVILEVCSSLERTHNTVIFFCSTLKCFTCESPKLRVGCQGCSDPQSPQAPKLRTCCGWGQETKGRMSHHWEGTGHGGHWADAERLLTPYHPEQRACNRGHKKDV